MSAFIVPSTSWHSPSGRRCDKGQISESTHTCLTRFETLPNYITTTPPPPREENPVAGKVTPNRSLGYARSGAFISRVGDIDYRGPNLYPFPVDFFRPPLPSLPSPRSPIINARGGMHETDHRFPPFSRYIAGEKEFERPRRRVTFIPLHPSALTFFLRRPIFFYPLIRPFRSFSARSAAFDLDPPLKFGRSIKQPLYSRPTDARGRF